MSCPQPLCRHRFRRPSAPRRTGGTLAAFFNGESKSTSDCAAARPPDRLSPRPRRSHAARRVRCPVAYRRLRQCADPGPDGRPREGQSQSCAGAPPAPGAGPAAAAFQGPQMHRAGPAADDGGVTGVCCQTTWEAAALVKAGFEDVMVTNQVVDPAAVRQLIDAAARSARLGCWSTMLRQVRRLARRRPTRASISACWSRSISHAPLRGPAGLRGLLDSFARSPQHRGSVPRHPGL